MLRHGILFVATVTTSILGGGRVELINVELLSCIGKNEDAMCLAVLLLDVNAVLAAAFLVNTTDSIPND